MEKLDVEFEKLARKTKRKRTITTILISIICAVIIFCGGIFGIEYLSGQHRQQLIEKVGMEIQINSPNVQTKGWSFSKDSLFGGTVIHDSYKNINGYYVKWSNISSKYSWLGADFGGDRSDMIYNQTSKFDMDEESYQKIAHFYNRKLTGNNKEPEQQIKELSTMTGYVGELAVTFDRDYTYQEILSLIPDNLMINWYWLGVAGKDDPNLSDEQGYFGIQAEDTDGTLTNEQYNEFLRVANKYGNLKENEGTKRSPLLRMLPTVTKEYKTLAATKFAGVILTGNTENFAQISNAPWIHASSIGATVQRLPYIQSAKQ